ncbi:hypothetical protein C3K47_15225 [Solitalea longa]|uniref:DUF5723 domain-containing protein n=1 Tax=Solitalea longa TaxID=2079460 RepID=A0A2S4ZYI7_9SPHI|nr:DUF5723 family protein [Solitalea longa]POY35411.1 hypothetical protein C3K47_15225 [Solitalea longa]
MKQRLTLIITLLLLSSAVFAQRIAVFGSGTLFESLENPAIRVLKSDCNLVQFNCFIPSFTADTRIFGDADTLLRNNALNKSRTLYHIPPLANPQNVNYWVGTTSINWIAAKILLDYRTHSELLIDVSSKAYGTGNIKNEAVSTFNSNNLEVGSYSNQFVTNSYGGAYTQVAFGFSRSINDFLTAGIKLGYASGINYGDLKFTNTRMDIQQSLNEPEENELFLSLTGSSKLLGKTDSLTANHFLPNFKNPGFTFSAGVNAQFNEDWEASLYVKDAGFINWNDFNREKVYDGRRYINGILLKDYSVDSVKNLLKFNDTTITQKHFRTSLPARLEGGVSGKILPYLRSSFFVSMPLQNWQSDLAIINDFFYKNYHFLLQAQYNTNNAFQVGTHFMIKSRVCDFIIGSDNLLGTIKLIKAANDDTFYYYDSRTTANVNFGVVFKFGKCYYAETATYIPMDDKKKSRTARRRVQRTKDFGE